MNRWEVIAWDGFARWWRSINWDEHHIVRTRKDARRVKQILRERSSIRKLWGVKFYPFKIKIYDRKLHKFVS